MHPVAANSCVCLAFVKPLSYIVANDKPLSHMILAIHTCHQQWAYWDHPVDGGNSGTGQMYMYLVEQEMLLLFVKVMAYETFSRLFARTFTTVGLLFFQMVF